MKMRMAVLSVAAAIVAGGVLSVSAATPDLQRVAGAALRMALKDAGYTIVDPADPKAAQPAKKLSRPPMQTTPSKPPASDPPPASTSTVPEVTPPVAPNEGAATNQVRRVDVGDGLFVEMVWCPPGRFLMGSPVGEPLRKSNEGQREAVITNGFWMGRFEVTRQLWTAVVGNDPSDFAGIGEASRYPVDNVSRDMCLDFISRLNERAPGVHFRLPTEAEWEYACRAGTCGPFGIGDEAGVADMQIRGSAVAGHPVVCGSFRPNAWGFYDMHGNVSEWCQDAYCKTPGSRPNGYVIRGGNWHERIVYARSAARLNYYSNRRSPQFGLRLAADSDSR